MSNFVQLLTLATAASALSVGRPEFTKRQQCKSWPGFSNLKYSFIFGDSYTQTGFNPNLTQPTPDNPFGNPAYPGYTSSNGPNWIDFLTTTWNQSLLQTVNLAYGGATVDSALVKPYQDTVLSFKDQVEKEYLPYYADKPAAVPWTSEDSLFGFFFGINDVGNSWWLQNATLYPTIFEVYSGLVDKLYQTGARNFLFLNVPPVELAPQSASNPPESIAQEGAKIEEFNQRIADLANNLTKTYSDATAFQFDTHTLFSKVIADPKSYEQTAPYEDVKTYCAAYQNGTPEWTSSDPSCPYPVDKYLWLNTLHPTFRIHNATAQAIAQQLSAGGCGGNLTRL
ncbi:RNA polymerase II-associated protein 1 [Elsinoe australis]|uniref:RNA polymerase II-associated protein 1 n=1 Tax=Elsinoe australis TaxID=40998 RepID=A0A2P7ZYB2_9PEZI|nr:RNA polymerase II-associated protein 1 [Elsinoe australis]